MQCAVGSRGSIPDAKVNAHRRTIGRRRVFVFDNDVDLPAVSFKNTTGLAPCFETNG
jgi:hypothetical protein